MRRGHSGGGWRDENPRHFRPRSGGNPLFRGPRPFGIADTPRFPSPALRYQGPRYNNHNALSHDHAPDHQDRSYRGSRPNTHRTPERNQPFSQMGPRQIFPLLQRMRQPALAEHNVPYNDPSNYYENNQNSPYVNKMGDMDHRHLVNPANLPSNREPYNQRVWSNHPYSDERSYRHQDNDHNKMPQVEYPSAGHRPPATDLYGGSHGSTMDNSNTFSRSVDDTVSIVRKRLQRRESQHMPDPLMSQGEIEKSREPLDTPYTDIQQEQPVKRKSHNISKIKNIKSNCNKIKNKIVHQLCMMDKDKIHKLMDNPNSSSKFEYAISSLITESQNSYNRHVRSAAEQSLCSSSSEFVHNNTNTIYEDTFMKQMQCILEPQDTVLLEDIKPIVLAELCKVLQLDDLDKRIEVEGSYSRDSQSEYNQYPNESYDYDNYQNYPTFSPTNEDPYHEEKPYSRPETSAFTNEDIADYGGRTGEFDREPLFERRQSRKSRDHNERRRSSSERRRSSSERRRSISERRRKDRNNDGTSDIITKRCDTPMLFDRRTEQLSDDDDPFAELDKQYHVAVDHNFIESYDVGSPEPSVRSMAQSPVVKKDFSRKVHAPEKPRLSINFSTNIGDKSPDLTELHKIKEELHSELQDMAKSPLKFSPPHNTILKVEDTSFEQQDPLSNNLSLATLTKNSDGIENKSKESVFKEETTPEPKAVEAVADKSDSSSMIKSLTPVSHSRKRSIDQRPPHRKEKRKKSESGPPDSTNKQILNKNIIINLNDCSNKSSEKCEAPKSVFNLFFSKDKSSKESSKESKKVDVAHSDKFVKKKDDKSSRKPKDYKDREKEKESEKRKPDSSSSSHSLPSPSETNSAQKTPTKTDAQTKLKPIDMFVEQTRRPSVHQAHRNTAPNAAPKAVVDSKPIVICRKMTKKHIATQVVVKRMTKEVQTEVSKTSCTRFSQTERKKLMTRGSQTEPVTFKTNSESTDTFERMKEIDMEIQALLQEKFKLYSSLESKTSCPKAMQSLGMTVLSVAPDPAGSEAGPSEDMIVEDFANMEELEDIAIETVQEKKKANVVEKRNRRTSKALEAERRNSQSPSTKANKNTRRNKTPNISLIEQIITDDRPLEDIISLDDLEESPNKTTKKSRKAQKPKKKSSKKVKIKPAQPIQPTNAQDMVHYDIKDCSVVLIRQDLEVIKNKLKRKGNKLEPVLELVEPESAADEKPFQIDEKTEATEHIMVPYDEPQNVFEENVVNDIQFDMLDVSEDIVIGDVCEVKSSEEKDITPICEEIILDNSQSSIEECGEGPADHEECKTYDYSADESLRRDCSIITGNGDAVLAIECIDDQFLAACLDGNVYHFSADGQLINTLRGSNLAVTCLTIVVEKYGTTVYTGSLDSRIRYYDLETGLEKGPECNVLSPIQTMDRAWDTVFVGTRTGFVLQFECKNNMLIPVSTIKFSEQCILALRAMKEGPRKVLLVAARSENVTIKDAQTGLLLRTLEGPKMTVYTLLYEDGKVYCGTSGHQIHVFDYASGTHMYAHESGKGVVCLRAVGGLLLAGCYDGCVYVYRRAAPRALAQLRGPSLMLLSLAVHHTKIIAGYKDRSLYIWKIPLNIIKEMIL